MYRMIMAISNVISNYSFDTLSTTLSLSLMFFFMLNKRMIFMGVTLQFTQNQLKQNE